MSAIRIHHGNMTKFDSIDACHEFMLDTYNSGKHEGKLTWFYVYECGMLVTHYYRDAVRQLPKEHLGIVLG